MTDERKAGILLVDDEEPIRKSIKDFLTDRISCDIHEAENGIDALEKIKHVKLDLIVVDIKMPGISGIDVIKQAKAMDPDVPILVMTKWDSSHVIEEAIRQGAVDYVPKPISMAVFGPKIKEILEGSNKYFPIA